jgi:hypothetical protein
VPDHQPQVVGRNLDQVALFDVPGATQPSAARAAMSRMMAKLRSIFSARSLKAW